MGGFSFCLLDMAMWSRLGSEVKSLTHDAEVFRLYLFSMFPRTNFNFPHSKRAEGKKMRQWCIKPPTPQSCIRYK